MLRSPFMEEEQLSQLEQECALRKGLDLKFMENSFC